MSATMLAASFPPLHPMVLPFVGLVPFALWVRSLPGDAEGRRSAVRGSLVFGVVHFGLLFYWIGAALAWFTWLAGLAFVGALAVLTGLAALFGWALHRLLHDVRAPLWVALPVTWTAAEWFRAHWPGPLAFPWLGLGDSLTGFPELVGIAEIVGALGVGFWLALVNGLLATLLATLLAGRGAGAGRTTAGLVAATAIVLVFPPAWGVWRAGTLELRAVGRVAVVQPDIPEYLKLDPAAALDSTLVALDELLGRVAPGSVQLVVLPEVAFPVYVRAPEAARVLARVQAYARETGAPVLFGALGSGPDGRGRTVPFNSAFLMEPQGLADFRYDKRYLVPVIERVPLPPIRLPRFGGFGVGEGWPLATVDEARYGTLICYESTYPEASRRFRQEGADAVVNITNDAWFGREPPWTRTTALWQHPAHLVMRAIENRMGVARAANTGISLFVDPVGRVHDATGLFQADVRAATVLTTDVTTFYTRHGDLVGRGAAMAALVLVLAALRLGGLGRAGGKGEAPRVSSLDPTSAPR